MGNFERNEELTSALEAFSSANAGMEAPATMSIAQAAMR
jgi:hypothetical protein